MPAQPETVTLGVKRGDIWGLRLGKAPHGGSAPPPHSENSAGGLCKPASEVRLAAAVASTFGGGGGLPRPTCRKRGSLAGACRSPAGALLAPWKEIWGGGRGGSRAVLRGLLVCVSHLEQGVFRKGTGHNLQAGWQALRVEAHGHGNGGQPRGWWYLRRVVACTTARKS